MTSHTFLSRESCFGTFSDVTSSYAMLHYFTPVTSGYVIFSYITNSPKIVTSLHTRNIGACFVGARQKLKQTK